MVIKTYTLADLGLLVGKDMGLDLSKKWIVNIHFYGDDDNYVFKFREKKKWRN